MELNIVLHQPEIPQNTGNIARTCAAVGARLHLIHPLGFDVSEKQVKRAGLDYWDKLNIKHYDDLDHFFRENPEGQYVFGTTKAKYVYSEIEYAEKCYLFFGKESAGLPEELLKEHPETCARIPMMANTRSLNLSNAVAIMTYEVLRQHNFQGLTAEGELHNLKWND